MAQTYHVLRPTAVLNFIYYIYNYLLFTVIIIEKYTKKKKKRLKKTQTGSPRKLIVINTVRKK